MTSLSSLNVALPTIQTQLGASTAELQWIVDAYAVVFGGLLLTGGAVGDRIGRRAALATGFAILAVGGTSGALSTDVETLIGARAISGLGAALMMPATLSTLTDVFAPAGQKQAIAIWSGVAGGGAAFGPAMSGWLLTVADWPAVFWLGTGLAVIGLAGVLVVPRLEPATGGALDLPGAALSTTTIALLLAAVIAAPDAPLAPTTLAAAVGAVVAAGAFVAWEARAPAPMLPLQVFANPRLRAGVATLLLGAIGFAGVLFVAALHLQLGWGETALVTGLLLVPIGVVELAVSTLSPRVCRRLGTSAAITLGLVAMAAGYVAMAATPTGSRILFALAGVVAGAGNGLVIPPSVERVVGGGDHELAGVTAGLNETSIELGASIGVALLGAVQRVTFDLGLPPGVRSESIDEALASADRDTVLAAFRSGSQLAFVVAALAALVAIGPARRPRDRQDRTDGEPVPGTAIPTGSGTEASSEPSPASPDQHPA